MARAPLFLPALAFTGAIAAEAHGLALLACAAALGTGAYRSRRAVAAFALAGLLIASWRGHPAMVSEESRTARFTGTVVGDVHIDENGATFPFALAGGMIVRAHVRDNAVLPGERLVVRGRLVPFDEARNPGEPSRRAIALGEGLAGELAVNRVIARAAPDPHDPRTWSARLRARLSARLRTAIPEPEATVLAGALWGERGTLAPDVRDDFQATGTVHVLVTAGLHLGLVAWLVMRVLRLLRTPRVARSLAAIPCVVAYAWLSGTHLPSQRAAVMVCAGLVASAYGSRLISWNSVALAALAVAAFWPASVTTVSFALSFSCIAAIALFAGRIEQVLERWDVPVKAREPLALTIATQIGVWPLSAATFGVVAPYAVLANAVVVPATMAGMIAGIAALLVAHVPVAGAFTATLATWDVDAILRIVGAVAAIPGARVWVAPPPALAIIAYDAAAVVAATLLRRSARRGIALLALASLGVMATTLRLPDGKLTVTMLDVGQGDAIVVRTPRGHVVLIDSGGRLERGPGAAGRSPAELVGERIVLAYLKRAGIRTVDLLVNTHPHGDHVGGCFPVIQALRVALIADSGQSYGGRAFQDCVAAARRRGIPVVLVRRGMHYATGDSVTLDALGPEEPLLADARNDVNENSVVLSLRYGCARCPQPFRMLFTGDAGARSEARILASGANVEADVLKVGHHGSAYSSTPAFVAAVRPRYALISVGRHNLFGHPAPSTITTLQDSGASIYRTDRCGAVRLDVDATVGVTTNLSC